MLTFLLRGTGIEKKKKEEGRGCTIIEAIRAGAVLVNIELGGDLSLTLDGEGGKSSAAQPATEKSTAS